MRFRNGHSDPLLSLRDRFSQPPSAGTLSKASSSKGSFRASATESSRFVRLPSRIWQAKASCRSFVRSFVRKAM